MCKVQQEIILIFILLFIFYIYIFLIPSNVVNGNVA